MQARPTFHQVYSDSVPAASSSTAVAATHGMARGVLVLPTTASEERAPALTAIFGRSVSFTMHELEDSRDALMEEVTTASSNGIIGAATTATDTTTWPQHGRPSRTTAVVHGADPASVAEKIAVMRHLEEVYAIPDYLAQHRDTMVDALQHPRLVDEFCREQICEWSYRVVDYFDINREVVDIALSFLDRFLAACSCDRRTYKLAATTALFLAVKLHDEAHKRINFLSVLANLSRGEFQERHVTEMERLMLRALGFRVHPPTAVAFINHIMLLPPFSIAEPQGAADSLAAVIEEEDSTDVRLPRVISRQIFDMACFYSELAVLDYSFVTNAPSVVALASILEAMARNDVPSKAYKVFCDVIERVLTEGIPADELLDVQTKLRRCYERAYGSHANNSHFGASSMDLSASIHGNSAQAASPVSVIPTIRRPSTQHSS